LATPIATPIQEALKVRPLVDAVGAVLAVAETIAQLHSEGVSHRDIKPNNLYQFQGRWVVGDLGLVDFPDKDSLTETGERLGPWNYLAPEMLEQAKHADGAMADVYSIAKTLWVLATEQSKPPPGEQRVDNAQIGIGAYRSHSRIRQLDLLIERSTRLDSAVRPSMAEFAHELRAWLDTPDVQPQQDITAILERIHAQIDPLLRVQNKRERELGEAQRLMHGIQRRFRPILEAFFATRLSDGTISEMENVQELLLGSQVLNLPTPLWTNGLLILASTHRAPTLCSSRGLDWVDLHCGVSVELFSDSTLSLTGGFVIGSAFGTQRIGLINRKATIGSAVLNEAVTELFNHLAQQLPFALEKFSKCIESKGENPGAPTVQIDCPGPINKENQANGPNQ
jgi:serine/threonine protein kinase